MALYTQTLQYHTDQDSLAMSASPSPEPRPKRVRLSLTYFFFLIRTAPDHTFVQVTPFLVRVFVKSGPYHPIEHFQEAHTLPLSDEYGVYVWYAFIFVTIFEYRTPDISFHQAIIHALHHSRIALSCPSRTASVANEQVFFPECLL